MYGMYTMNGVYGSESRSSGGNTSSNPQVSALIPRPTRVIALLWFSTKTADIIDGLVQERRNFIAKALNYVFLALTHRYLCWIIYVLVEIRIWREQMALSMLDCRFWTTVLKVAVGIWSIRRGQWKINHVFMKQTTQLTRLPKSLHYSDTASPVSCYTFHHMILYFTEGWRWGLPSCKSLSCLDLVLGHAALSYISVCLSFILEETIIKFARQRLAGACVATFVVRWNLVQMTCYISIWNDFSISILFIKLIALGTRHSLQLTIEQVSNFRNTGPRPVSIFVVPIQIQNIFFSQHRT